MTTTATTPEIDRLVDRFNRHVARLSGRLVCGERAARIDREMNAIMERIEALGYELVYLGSSFGLPAAYAAEPVAR